jgi:uncharacterized protein (DUF885 family)
MLRIVEYIAIALVSAALAALALGLHTWFGKPLSINWFYTKSFLQLVLDEPETLTAIRIFEQFGIRGHNAKLSDGSNAADEARLAKLIEIERNFRHYDARELTGAAAISHAVFNEALKQRIEQSQWRHHSYPVTQLQGVHTWLPSLITQQQRIDDATDAEHFIARLHAIPKRFSQVIVEIEAQAKAGILPPRFAIEKAITQLENFGRGGPDANVFVRRLHERVDAIDTNAMSAEKKASLKLAAREAAEREVLPAYQALATALRSLLARAPHNHGVWAQPNGAAYYQKAIEWHTTTTMKAEELHRLGLREVARIGRDIETILAQISPQPGTRAERIKRITLDPSRRYPDTDAGRDAVLRDYQSIIDEISANLKGSFHQIPSVGLIVKRVPKFAEGGAPAAYYESPPLDRSAPGVFYANLADVNATPKHGMRTLAYHEAIPGHHMQTAIAQTIEGLPLFRTMVSFTAYDEGWALYAERLAWELGFHKDPYDNLGRLQDEMLRAVRLVVDTGIHEKRWTREQAVSYMVAEIGLVESEAVIEVERYFVDPAQALAYTVGMNKILELRERAKTTLGPKFDLRDFHAAVLTNGSMPLTVLERVIDDYIARSQR